MNPPIYVSFSLSSPYSSPTTLSPTPPFHLSSTPIPPANPTPPTIRPTPSTIRSTPRGFRPTNSRSTPAVFSTHCPASFSTTLLFRTAQKLVSCNHKPEVGAIVRKESRAVTGSCARPKACQLNPRARSNWPRPQARPKRIGTTLCLRSRGGRSAAGRKRGGPKKTLSTCLTGVRRGWSARGSTPTKTGTSFPTRSTRS